MASSAGRQAQMTSRHRRGGKSKKGWGDCYQGEQRLNASNSRCTTRAQARRSRMLGSRPTVPACSTVLRRLTILECGAPLTAQRLLTLQR